MFTKEYYCESDVFTFLYRIYSSESKIENSTCIMRNVYMLPKCNQFRIAIY